MSLNRRDLLIATLALLVFQARISANDNSRRRIIKDYSGIDEVSVAAELRPLTTREVSRKVKVWQGPISVGGGRYSMGGQVAAPDSLHLDMRQMNRVVEFNPDKRLLRVQSGITWRDIQDVIDPKDLSVRIMQSFSNFTVGGSVSVNCHGRYLGKGPLVNSVRALQLVLANGEVRELKPDDELFRGIFGGYGGLGVITEVELDLDRNTRIRRVVQKIELEEYPYHFLNNIASRDDVVLHNADLRPPQFSEPRMINWIETDRPATVPDRLIPKDRDYSRDQTLLWAVSELPGGKRLRRQIEDDMLEEEAIVWRNYEASLDTDSLEPRTRLFSTYLLQEYFIPVENFLKFTKSMTEILKKRNVNALNVSIRHSPKDSKSLMCWAKTDVFSFVLYYKQRNSKRAREAARVWTRELIDAALENGGRYYLPYRLLASQSQFEKSYPEITEFALLKSQVDPSGKFQNLLWNTYL